MMDSGDLSRGGKQAIGSLSTVAAWDSIDDAKCWDGSARPSTMVRDEA